MGVQISRTSPVRLAGRFSRKGQEIARFECNRCEKPALVPNGDFEDGNSARILEQLGRAGLCSGVVDCIVFEECD